MLNRIEITGLYGHYTYDLPLSSGQRKDICFLTGPNGYGCRIRGGSGGQELLYTIYSLTFAQTNRISGLREA